MALCKKSKLLKMTTMVFVGADFYWSSLGPWPILHVKAKAGQCLDSGGGGYTVEGVHFMQL